MVTLCSRCRSLLCGLTLCLLLGPRRGSRVATQGAPALMPQPTRPPPAATNPGSGQQLTAAALAAAAPAVQKRMIGEHLFPAISKYQPELAAKITGMMLEMDNSELLTLLDSEPKLKAQVDEATRALAHQILMRTAQPEDLPRPAVRSKTVAPKPELALLRAEEGTRVLRQRSGCML